MRRLSARFALLSALVLAGYAGFAAADSPATLQQDDLKNPDVISSWLTTNGAAADRRQAEVFFRQGTMAKAKHQWGLAAKGFGESALQFPSPTSLVEYAEAKLHELSDIRVREKTVAKYRQSDIATVEAVLRSALAADAVLNTLSVQEMQQVRRDAKCLEAFLRSGDDDTTCRPLRLYEHQESARRR